MTELVRRATTTDIPALVELRAVMIESIFDGPSGDDWRDECARVLQRRLADTDGFAAFVVDGADGVPVACGIGWVEQHLPGPRNLSGRFGHIASMSTLPEHRGQGYARLVLGALMDWYAEIGVPRVHLNAAPMGERLYREMGFTDRQMPALTSTRP